MFSVTAFYTRLADSFTEQFVAKQGSIERWERVNSDGAKVKGVEIDLGIRPLSSFEVRGGVTYKKSQYDSPNEDFGTRNFLRTPDLTGNLRLSLVASSNLDIYLHGNYFGKAEVPHEVVSADQEDPLLLLEKSNQFFQADIGLTYKLPLNNGLNMKFNIGIKNIFDAYQSDLDQGPDRDPAYVYGPTRPRTLFFGIETAF